MPTEFRRPARLVLFGAPGVGKGTQAVVLSEEYGVPHISTGDLLRGAMTPETPMALRIKGIVEKGELVPDDLVSAILDERLKAQDARSGFILDGFPRTAAQAGFLDSLLRNENVGLDGVINLEVQEKEILLRLIGRRVCGSCGAIIHLRSSPPRKEGRCDACDGPLEQRADDTEAAIAERLRAYEAQTKPVVDYYRSRGLLLTIDGNGKPEAVRKSIREALRARRG